MTFSALDSALTGPLFTTAAMRAVFSDHARLGNMLAMEAALARVQARAGLVPPELAEAIAEMDPDSLDAAAIGGATATAGVPTIPFLKAVQAKLPKALEPHLHKGATTQDVVDTALVLSMRDGFSLLRDELGATIAALAARAQEARDWPCVGRTYGQHAAPVSFGFKIAVWLVGLVEVAQALPALRERTLTASLAGPVGTLASLGERGPEIADAFAAELGLSPAPLAWHARRGRMFEAGAWLVSLVGALAKMASDTAHLCSTEVAELAEPHMPGRGGSSAMPHKRNPVSATVILAAHAAAPGLLMPLAQAMAAAHERPAGLWHGEWHALPQLFGLAAGALAEGRRLAEGMELDPQRMRANIDATSGLLFADAVAARLSPTLGRAVAHELVEHVAATVRRTGRHLRDTVLELPQLREAAVDISPAFDLAPAVAACQPWIDRALAQARSVLPSLQRG